MRKQYVISVTAKTWFCLLFFINCLFQCAVVYGQSAHSVNGNVFLKDQHVQVGIAPCGSFGTSDEVPVGQGYYPRSSYHNQLGFVADPAQDGWTTGMPDFIGDYFLPGTLTNLSSNPISDIYYMRNVDPDHEWRAGIYFLRLTDGSKQQATTKLIVIK